MAKNATHPPTARRLVSLEKAAEYLGVAPLTIRRRIADGTIRGYRVDGTRAVRVDLTDVDAMLRPIPAGGAA